MANQAGVKIAGLKLPTRMAETPSISGSIRMPEPRAGSRSVQGHAAQPKASGSLALCPIMERRNAVLTAVISAVLPASLPPMAQRPVKLGLRFSTKARTPSAKSALAAQSAKRSPSACSCSSSDAWGEAWSSRLVLA